MFLKSSWLLIYSYRNSTRKRQTSHLELRCGAGKRCGGGAFTAYDGVDRTYRGTCTLGKLILV